MYIFEIIILLRHILEMQNFCRFSDERIFDPQALSSEKSRKNCLIVSFSI